MCASIAGLGVRAWFEFKMVAVGIINSGIKKSPGTGCSAGPTTWCQTGPIGEKRTHRFSIQAEGSGHMQKRGEEQMWFRTYSLVHSCTHTHNHARPGSGITVSSLYLIEVEAIFPQVAACLIRAGLIRVKGICLLLLNIPKYYSIYRVIYMLMHRLPLHRPFDAGCMLPVRTVMCARTKRGLKRQKEEREWERERWKGKMEVKREKREDTEAERKGDIPLGECHR